MYDTNTRVHDCWDFDLAPNAKHVKGIKPCIKSSSAQPPPPPCEGSSCKFTTMVHTKCNAPIERFLTKTTLDAVKAECSRDSNCAGFDWFVDNDSGVPCAKELKPGEGCGAMKRSCTDTITDNSNTAYIKQGFVAPTTADTGPDGIAFSSVEAFNRDITGELVAAARKGGIIPGLYVSQINWFRKRGTRASTLYAGRQVFFQHRLVRPRHANRPVERCRKCR
eukprot:SAG31_NODE_382_length_16456_cov_5.532983_5_plen_222_part_00